MVCWVSTGGLRTPPSRAGSPSLFNEQSAGVEVTDALLVDASSPRPAKVALFGSLFVGRDDVYALRWENTRTGKAGWGPAVRGGWSNAATTRTRVPAIDRRDHRAAPRW